MLLLNNAIVKQKILGSRSAITENTLNLTLILPTEIKLILTKWMLANKSRHAYLSNC